jgi:hypothetical protein
MILSTILVIHLEILNNKSYTIDLTMINQEHTLVNAFDAYNNLF